MRPGDLAGLAVIVLVAVLVNAAIGFDTLAAPVILLLVLGALVLAEHKLVLPGNQGARRHAAG